MKKNSFVYALCLLMMGTLLFTACKKSDDVTPDQMDDKPAFVGKRWQVSAFTLEPAVDLDDDGKPDSDLLKYIPACSKDDIIIFKADGKMDGEAGVRCPDDEPNGGVRGSWTYDKNTRILRIIGNENPTDADEMEVVEMSASTLKTKVSITEDGITLTAFMTFKAK